MATQILPYVSPEEYLERDRAAERRSEYINGQMYVMAGASLAHMVIVNNVSVDLSIQTRGRCRVFTNDFRLFVPKHTSYFYPDVGVICGAPDMVGDRNDIFKNPKVLVEIVSQASGTHDRTTKFGHCRQIPSLDDYLIIDQFQPLVEHYSRQPDGGWLFREYTSMDNLVQLPSIGAQLKIPEVYRDIDFTARI